MELKEIYNLKGKTAVVTGGGDALAGTLASALGDVGVIVAVLDLRRGQRPPHEHSERVSGS